MRKNARGAAPRIGILGGGGWGTAIAGVLAAKHIHTLCAQKRIVLQISTSVYRVLHREADSYGEVGYLLDRMAVRTRGR